MLVKITYFVHGTTTDNEKHLASGWNDVELSELGVIQSKQLGDLRKDHFDFIFTSDLKRAVETAKLAFTHRCRIIQDKRLRECDYGDLTQKKKTWNIADFINIPYPNGESYEQAGKRIKDFLDFLKESYDGKHVAIVAHQMPQLALDVFIKGMSWKEAIENDWRNSKDWRPGWEYELK